MEYISKSVDDTGKIITALCNGFVGGNILVLQGDLGSGKTTSAKFIAKYFGVDEEMTSPTFVIMKNYPLPHEKQGINEIVHMDAYRLHGAPDAESIGLSDHLKRNDVLVIIEWPENIANIVPEHAKEIRFEHLDGDSRKITTNYVSPPQGAP